VASLYAVSLSTGQALGIGLIVALTATNVFGLRYGKLVQNLFTVTKYPGLNPDLPWYSTVGYNGVDNYQAIPSRVFLVGVNLNL